MNLVHCLHIVLVIGKYKDVFRGIFLAGEVGDWGYVGESFHGESIHGGRDISMKGVPDFPAIFKNDRKLNKKSFLAESKEQY